MAPRARFELARRHLSASPKSSAGRSSWLVCSTRLACVPLLIDICVALCSTKIVTFMKNGFWGTLHEARTDVSMLLGLIFLLLVGGGTLALDARYPEGLDPKS